MLRQGLGLAAFALAIGPAMAADLPVAYPASPPASGSPLYSPSSITGDLSLGLGWTGMNGHLSSSSISGLAGGRVNIPFGGGWNEELEANGTWMFNGKGSAAGVFSHTYYKNQSWASGLLLGYSSINPSGGSVGTVGVEGIVFMPSTSVLGRIAYNGANASLGGNYWDVGLEGRYYFEPNTKVTGAVDYFSAKPNAWQFTAALEHRWTGTPFSTFASANYLTQSGSNSWGVMIGARFAFDQHGATLQSHDFEVPFAASTAVHF